MTPHQKRLLDFIGAYTKEHGYAPLHSEMAAHMGTTKGSGISRALSCLKDQGRVIYTPAQKRSVRIIDKEPFLEAAYEYARCPSLKGFQRLQDALHECYGET